MAGHVRCPICLSMVDWANAETVTLDADGRPEPLVRLDGEDDVRWNHRRLDAYRLCAGGGGEPHVLPGRYGDFGEPLVIGVVGESAAGKSHLLAAMLGMLSDVDRMARLGLVVGGLDLKLHQRYLKDVVRPFLDQGQGLAGTPAQPPEFTDALWIHNSNTGRSFAVAFFDVSGEWLADHDSEVPFLGAVSALVFVVDPTRIRGLTAATGSVTGDPSFGVVLDKIGRLRGVDGSQFLPLPAAVVIGKCDLLRHHEGLVDRWFQNASPDEELNLATVEEESEDAYAFLSSRGARGWLAPFVRCARSTLHFATATGHGAVETDGLQRSPHGSFAPRRTLKPMLALFAMCGVLGPTDLGQGAAG
ncbi:hypothetical protein [Streptomyces griseomycini]|uniref:Energy-coupling factor transporter ATP-binding protein EcfA2 n=1 Tax=Streptomyces griseomycini TaxID=66895 RepID=A0A7W7PUN6_9ACTN|nr:hypothetical protein [Streptomyces griseomycini]MBB4901579.1 energy-coupling factor transporter ATP-binding protein EcfA2 [Streptomyces griseomycini]GGQ22009.1 hypothetical protein GCM10010266_51420 [Streptomyces griseomycini]GGR44598.1 hypothetical protein GCM10015536_58160 [Streptomyces griseomycini]